MQGVGEGHPVGNLFPEYTGCSLNEVQGRDRQFPPRTALEKLPLVCTYTQIPNRDNEVTDQLRRADPERGGGRVE